MILYNCKSDKVPWSLKDWNFTKNYYRVKDYDSNLHNTMKAINDIYYTYNILVSFNNELDKNKDLSVFERLKENLDEHKEIKNSEDVKCRVYYDKMLNWYNLYVEYPFKDTCKKICDEVQQELRQLCKQGIVKESGLNLKNNYYD